MLWPSCCDQEPTGKVVKVVKVVKMVIGKGKRMFFKKSIKKSGYWETTSTVNYSKYYLPITIFLS